MTRLPSSALLVTALLSAAACQSSGREATPSLPVPTSTPVVTHSLAPTHRPATPKKPVVHARPVAAALVPYRDCTQLVEGLRAEALKEVTPYGLQQAYGYGRTDAVPVAAPMAAGAGTTTGGTTGGASVSAGTAAAPGFSQTNNQEADVDEPDVVKTDGTLMVVLRQNPMSVAILDVTGAHPRQVGSLAVSLQGSSMLLSGRTLVVLGDRPTASGSDVVAEVYDLSDAAHPTHTRTFRVEGSMLDARFVHGRVLLVTRSAPAMRFSYPTGPADEPQALAQNKQVIRRTSAADWLPSVRVTPRGKTYQAQCSKASHPGVASGTSTTSLVTLDPAKDEPTSNRTVVGGSDMLYASSRALYLATSSWQSQQLIARGQGGESTDLHGFDITDPDAPSYLGTGSLPGSLVDRYALSEQDGYLRVATTIGTPVPPQGEGTAPTTAALSDNRVTVLKPVDGTLKKVGEVRGLGRGQKVFGVRFLGDVGYVVTFRQLDPLYALDLSEPTRPVVRGELHISGYSSALYPLTAGQLLGVGADVGDHQQQLGAQAEVFDVRRLARPALTGKLTWANAYGPAATDHHALLWWPAKRLVVMPLSEPSGLQDAVVMTVGAGGTLKELGRVRAPSGGQQECCYNNGIQRAVVVGDQLYSLSDSGVVTNPLDKVDQQRWLPFH